MSLNKFISSFSLLILMPGLASAQTQSMSDIYSQYQVEIVLTLAGAVLLIALISLFAALYALMAIVNLKKEAQSQEQEVSKEGFWLALWNKMNATIPIEEESTVMTDHAYDGIRELDNKLPPWWLYSFYATIVFAVVYIFHFHVFETGDLQEAEYQAEMIKADEEVQTYLASLDNLIDESTVEFSEDEVDMLAGKELFISKCAACHGQNGEGGIGPNFTDKYWIHGGDIASIFKTIKYGVPSKGMISWKSQINPKEMQQVSSYIYALEGTNPLNPKDPEGELFEREIAPSTSEAGI